MTLIVQSYFHTLLRYALISVTKRHSLSADEVFFAYNSVYFNLTLREFARREFTNL